MSGAANHHCCVVTIGDAGVLIEGKSGSGKTSLALGLVAAGRQRELSADFVCDDQALLEAVAGKLIARQPAAIAGLVELRGHGIVSIATKSSTQIGLVVRLVGDQLIERMPVPLQTVLQGIALPLIEVPARHEARAIRITLARLGLPLV